MRTKEELIAFEAEVARRFDNKEIRAPVHLDGGNEEQLIQVFQDVDTERDWICGSWRMHYKCLLHGVPSDKLKAAILAGDSITLCFPAHRIISSAIVGGILPIATGIAFSIKRSGGTERVWCFLGDMTYRTGMFRECYDYAENFDLPIVFVVEDNKKSVVTVTREAWGENQSAFSSKPSGKFRMFEYDLPFPHSGAGTRVQF